MSGEKHTLGPWRVQPGFLTVYALSHGDHGTTIALAKALYDEPNHTWSACPDQKEAEANARLIAAAPQMFEAIRALIQEHDDTYDGEPMTGEKAVALDSARASLAAVIGEA